MVELDYAVTQAIALRPAAALRGLAAGSSSAPTDLIGEGDVLAISVVEAGSGGLFARPGDAAGDTQQGLPRVVVDRSGSVFVPFAGQVHVAGLTPREAAIIVERALTGRAINPQVTLTVVESRTNAVVIIGAVKNSGHVPLSAHNDRLLDVVASAGGPTRTPADLLIEVIRGDRSAETTFANLLIDPAQNIRLAPQDQVRLLERPRKYSTFGAVGRVAQSLIEDDTLTLAEAISRAGGLDTNSANAGAVMVFRFERPEVATALGVRSPPAGKGVPVVYRLNYSKPESVFVADNFQIQPNDLIYVPRSDITEAYKFLTLVNQVTQIGYNARVVGTLP